MSTQFRAGESVVVEVGRGMVKHGNIQRFTENVVYVKHYNGSVVGYKHEVVSLVALQEQAVKPYNVGLSSEFAAYQQVLEKKLTPAELKKREEVATAMERENPGMDMSKKMAIATATAKKVAEETEETNESHQANSTMKYVKNPTPGEKQAAKDIKPGVGGYRDRIAMLKSAQARGALKEADKKMEGEDPCWKDYEMIGTKKVNGKEVPNCVPKNENMHYCAKHVFSERFGDGLVVEGSHAEPNETGLIEWYDVDFGGAVRRVMTEKVKVMHAEYHMNHKKKMKEEEELEEAKPHTIPKTSKEKDLAKLAPPFDKITHADVLTGRGVKKEEMSSKEKMKRGLYNKQEELTGNQHRIDKNKNGKIDAHDFKLLRKEESLDEAETQNLPGKATHLLNKDVRHEDHGIISNGTTLRSMGGDKYEVRAGKAKGKMMTFGKQHIQKLSMEEVDLNESMISYSDFSSKLAAHRKAGNKIKDDKYDDKKASYTVVDQDGVGKKITHTSAGVKQDHLGQVEKMADTDDEKPATAKRGRPAGSKSGARN